MEARSGFLSNSWWANLARRRAVRLLVVAVAAGGLLAIGFFVGQRQSRVMTLTGVAAVGSHQALVTVGGWSYGIDGSVEFWIDSEGGAHDGGWPNCLRLGQRPRISFGAIPVSAPGGTSWRQVVWVDCRG